LQATAQTAATKAAQDVAGRFAIAGQTIAPADVSVLFPNGGAASFGINPTVSVTVQNTNLPTFFSRIWNRAALTVRVTAKAEAFNPSNSSSLGTGIPTVARCVKPFIIPNCDPDPGHGPPGPNCGGAATLINPATGEITNARQTPAGIIGETFTLQSACTNAVGPGCLLPGVSTAGRYYPAQFTVPANISCPSCATGGSDFQTNVECCNPTPLTCGPTVPAPPDHILPVDTTILPDKGPGPAETGLQCLIHAAAPGFNNGQDELNGGALNSLLTYPLQIEAGASHPLPALSGQFITTSDSIITLPIYDGAPVAANVNIIGFMQVFVNRTYGDGRADVTILNVAGCGSSATGTPVYGSGVSAVPVRLIQ
jgi:hypothetical protein